MKIIESVNQIHALTDEELKEWAKANEMIIHIYNVNDKTLKNNTIINLDNVGTGSHWVCYFCNRTSGIYFDPFGNIMPNNIKKLMKNKTINYISNEIQPLKSVMCGYYCMLFLYMMKNGHNVDDFLYLFKWNNEPDNDKRLITAIKKM